MTAEAVWLSVSAVCLAADRASGVAALLDQPVVDLHCDFFPSMSRQESLTEQEITSLREIWHRQLTVHYWNARPGAQFGVKPAPGDRLLIEHVYDSGTTLLAEVERFRSLGWDVGVSLVPEETGIPDEVLEPGLLRAIQILSTNTPGAAGGSFRRTAVHFAERVADELARQDLKVDLEIDGGVNSSVIRELRGRCRLFVLGTNAHVDRHGHGFRLDATLVEETRTGFNYTAYLDGSTGKELT